ncbi:MAG: glycosyltransferase family 39 protein [Butyrivibrio sp.]|uniref:ArnT family glycosyltransferase n=1 Tax=Butyrivibrio sp. TaxID=28121 RepID=UPI0025E84D61|nr:glycosyltransferase family 39 protein [Butyrivibrio sp.]MCR5773025.1 glycosyltransferase family 39 protein [Butyrivibrio sp.]
MNKKILPIYALPIVSVVVLIIISIVMLSKPLTHYEGTADTFTSDLGILLPEFPDHPQEGIYADNSLSDDSISITSDSNTLSAGSYIITLYYLAESNMNTLTLSTGNETHPIISGYEKKSIPESDLSGYSFTINSLTSLKDLTITIDYEGDSYIYVTGYSIQETRNLAKRIIECAFLILLIINLVFIYLYKYKDIPYSENVIKADSSYTNVLPFIKSTKSYDIAALIIIITGALVRILQLGYIPGWGGVAQDEAYAGYEAYSLLHYGIDSHGYSMPVYLEAWGSGMNALETYLEMPFIKLLGLSSISIRIPQMIIGVLILPAFYGCCKIIRNDSFGLIGLIVLTISPWQILATRWGLEANLLPAFMVFGTYFLLKASTNRYMIYLSMICYGLSLYCYAAAWVVMPLIIGCSLIYLIIKNYIRIDIHLFISMLILGIMAAPLLLFVLVNTDHLIEIVTPLLSIPRLTVFRSSEVALTPAVMIQNLSNMFEILFISQDDNLGINAVPTYGIYYRIGPIFILIGILVSIYKIIKSIITHKNILNLNTLFLIWFIWCILHGCLVESDLTRINIIYIPLTYMIAEGIYSILEALHKITSKSSIPVIIASLILAIIYTSLFARFELTYMSLSYNKDNVSHFDYGLADCLSIAQNNNAETIYINVLYPVILFEDKFPAPDFVNTVVYKDVHASFLEPESFGNYILGDFTNNAPSDNAVYICKEDDTAAISYFNQSNMKQEQYGTYIIANITQ